MSETVQDTVDSLCRLYGGTFERQPSGGAVTVRLRTPNGEVIAATGATTAQAVNLLQQRVAFIMNPPPVE